MWLNKVIIHKWVNVICVSDMLGGAVSPIIQLEVFVSISGYLAKPLYKCYSFLPSSEASEGRCWYWCLFSLTLNNWIERKASVEFILSFYATNPTHHNFFLWYARKQARWQNKKVAFLVALSLWLKKSVKEPITGTIWSASGGFANSSICHPPFTAWGPWQARRGVLKTGWWD